MAYAFGFSNRGPQESMYGDKIRGSNGNGETYGEMTTHVEDSPYASQLTEIAVMRSAIGEHPLTEEEAKRLSCPSDELVLEYLAFDESMILSRMDPDYKSAILETYPDMPDLLLEAPDNSTELAAVMEEIAQGCAADALKVFRERPIEFLEDLSAEESHKVMMALAISKVNLSELTAPTGKELINA